MIPRYFIDRLLEAFRNTTHRLVNRTDEIRKDVDWFIAFVPMLNGTAFYNHETIDFAETLEIDTCLTHVRGVWKKPGLLSRNSNKLKSRNSNKLKSNLSITSIVALFTVR